MSAACLFPLRPYPFFHHPPLLSWSRWLILKGNSESEWDLKEKEERCSTQQGHPSLDWYAARREGKKNNNTWDRRAFPSLCFFLSSTSLLFTAELFDISLFLSFGGSSDLNVHKPLELQRYTSVSIPSSSSFLIPLPSNRWSLESFLPCRAAKKDVETSWQTPTFFPIMHSVHRLLLRHLCLVDLIDYKKLNHLARVSACACVRLRQRERYRLTWPNLRIRLLCNTRRAASLTFKRFAAETFVFGHFSLEK